MFLALLNTLKMLRVNKHISHDALRKTQKISVKGISSLFQHGFAIYLIKNQLVICSMRTKHLPRLMVIQQKQFYLMASSMQS